MINIDTVIYFQVTDPKAATYEIADYIGGDRAAHRHHAAKRDRRDDARGHAHLARQDQRRARHVLDEATGKWGIRVNRVELKAVDPPHSIQEAMEKQMRAERDRRAAILTAEGVKQSQILTAEGEKQWAILRAEGRREAQILEAEGQSKAIETVFEAIHRGDADPKLLAYQYLQVLPQIAQGESNKVWIIPSEVTRRWAGSHPKRGAPEAGSRSTRTVTVLRPHGTDDRGVELVRDAALALAPVVVGEHPRGAGAPAAPSRTRTADRPRCSARRRPAGRARSRSRACRPRAPSQPAPGAARRCGARWSRGSRRPGGRPRRAAALTSGLSTFAEESRTRRLSTRLASHGVFDALSDRLQAALDDVRSRGKLTEDDVNRRCARCAWRCSRPT